MTIWDLSVEADEGGSGGKQGEGVLGELPPQLLFIHQGQKEVKEVHYHPQVPGVVMSSAEDGMDIFKPAINVIG